MPGATSGNGSPELSATTYLFVSRQPRLPTGPTPQGWQGHPRPDVNNQLEWRAVDAAAISLASTFGFGAANVAHTLTPNLSDVRTANPTDDEVRTKVRTGQTATTLIVGATGLVLWRITGDTLPLVLSGTILAMTFLAYEYALRAPKPRKSDPQAAPSVLAYG